MPTRERRTFVCATTCCSSRMVTCTSCARYSSSCAQPWANVSAPSTHDDKQGIKKRLHRDLAGSALRRPARQEARELQHRCAELDLEPTQAQ